MDARIKRQLEHALGRSLTDEEMATAPALSQLSDAQVVLGRYLAERQLVLCMAYLGELAPPLDHRTGSSFIGQVLLGTTEVGAWCPFPPLKR